MRRWKGAAAKCTTAVHLRQARPRGPSIRQTAVLPSMHSMAAADQSLAAARPPRGSLTGGGARGRGRHRTGARTCQGVERRDGRFLHPSQVTHTAMTEQFAGMTSARAQAPAEAGSSSSSVSLGRRAYQRPWQLLPGSCSGPPLNCPTPAAGAMQVTLTRRPGQGRAGLGRSRSRAAKTASGGAAER